MAAIRISSSIGAASGPSILAAPEGTLTALGSTLVGSNPASHPLDEGVSVGQHYLYVLADGLSRIVGYRVGRDGSLTQVATIPVGTGSAGIGTS